MCHDSVLRPHQRKLIPFVLVCLYMLLALFFYFAASFVKSPLIITDEVQYRLLAENLYRYGEFVLRDNFVATIPPLYSVLLFIGKKLFILNSLQFYQIVNAFLFSLSLIPLYLIARVFSLSIKDSFITAILGCIIPQSFYISLCMSENLYYPLFLFFIYFSLLFVENPTLCRSIFVGIIGGLCVLTKMSACIVIISFIFVSIIIGLYDSFCKKNVSSNFINNRYFLYSSLSLVLIIIVYSPWIYMKYKNVISDGSIALGAYYSNLEVMFSKIFSVYAVKMIIVYFSDIIFSSGFVLLVPVIYISIKIDNSLDRRKYFLIFIVAIALVLTSALFSGLNSTWLRERHMFMVVPLIVILFFKSISVFSDKIRNRIELVVWNFVVCMTALFFLEFFYDFKLASPVLESPWIEILQFYSLFGVQWTDTLNNIAIFLFPLVVLLSVIFFFKKKYIVRFIYFWLFIFFLTTSTTTYSMMTKWSQSRLNSKTTDIVKWLGASLGDHKKIMIIGRPSYFEPKNNSKFNEKLISWSEHFLLSDISIYRLEMVGLYDVKMIPNIGMLDKFSRNGSYYLLSPMTFEGMKKISEYGPLILYDTRNLQSDTNISFKYKNFIDPRWFFSVSGEYLDDGKGVSLKSTGTGYVVYGPYWSLPPGDYEVEFMLRCPVDSLMNIDVFCSKLGEVSGSTVTCHGNYLKKLQFSVTGNDKYEFRVDLNRGHIFFKGVNLRKR